MTVFSISIVSHGHARHVRTLLSDLAALSRRDFEVVLTLNYSEDLMLDLTTLPYRVEVINNTVRKGFAGNHNAAFAASKGDNFVILNPDVELLDDPFAPISELMAQFPSALYAPMVVDHAGMLEDSMRFFPSPGILLKKLLAKLLKRRLHVDAVPSRGDVLMPDWVAGMFIVVPRAIYSQMNGLSERYHMYYEDVDFCARAKAAGYNVLVSKRAKVIHEAQRDSHRKMQYLFWHVQSAVRFFTSEAYLKIRLRRLTAMAPR